MTRTTRTTSDRIQWSALLSLALAVFLGSLDQSIANTALPAIGAALQRTPAESVWVIHAYQLAVVAVLLPLAALGDRWGARKVFLLGAALFNLAALASACATHLEWLAFFRAVQGVGAAGVMSVNLALIQRIFPPAILGGVGLGILSAGMVGLGAVGPETPFALMALSMALCGVGFGLFQSPNLRAIMASAPAHRTSGASGMVAMARLMGQASGAALVALCFNLFGPLGAGRAVVLGAVTAGLGALLSFARLRAR